MQAIILDCTTSHRTLFEKLLYNENNKKVGRTIRQAIVVEHACYVEKLCQGYNSLYQIAWACVSKEDKGFEKLEELNARAHVIEENYKLVL